MSYRCQGCNRSMVVDENAKRHTYVCSDDECGLRAVIVPDGSGGVFRYDLPKVLPFPSRTGGETPRPKGGASFAPSGGRGESDDGTRAVLNVIEDFIPGGIDQLMNRPVEETAQRLLSAVQVEGRPDHHELPKGAQNPDESD